jgi:hypothetical protein
VRRCRECQTRATCESRLRVRDRQTAAQRDLVKLKKRENYIRYRPRPGIQPGSPRPVATAFVGAQVTVDDVEWIKMRVFENQSALSGISCGDDLVLCALDGTQAFTWQNCIALTPTEARLHRKPPRGGESTHVYPEAWIHAVRGRLEEGMQRRVLEFTRGSGEEDACPPDAPASLALTWDQVVEYVRERGCFPPVLDALGDVRRRIFSGVARGSAAAPDDAGSCDSGSGGEMDFE